MPEAIQLCQGSSRLVRVVRFRADDRADCSFCNARLKSERRDGPDLYYVMPPHRPDGTRDPSKIDWTQVNG